MWGVQGIPKKFEIMQARNWFPVSILPLKSKNVSFSKHGGKQYDVTVLEQKLPFNGNLCHQKRLLIRGKQQKIRCYCKAVGENSFCGCKQSYGCQQEQELRPYF